MQRAIQIIHTGAGRPVNMAAIFFLLVSIAVWIISPVSGQGLGQSCGANNQCDPGLECSSKTGANTDDKCRIPVAGSTDCNGTDDNCVVNAVCDSGTCKLDVGKTCTAVGDTNCKTGTTCVNVASSGSADYQCRYNVNVQGCSSSPYCLPSLVCDNNFCKKDLEQSCSDGQCKTNTQCTARVNDGTKCRYKANIPGCNSDDKKCVPSSVCEGNTCKVNVGEQCSTSPDSCITGTKCVSVGTNGYQCRRKYASPCTYDYECQTTQHQTCMTDKNGTNRCLCKSGYFKQSSQCASENLLVAQNIAMNGSPQEKSISLKWQKPTALGGALFDCQAKLSSGQTTHLSNWTSNLYHIFSGLTPGTTYTATINTRTPRNPGYGNAYAEHGTSGGSFYTKPAKPGNLTMSQYPGPDVTLLFRKSEGHVDCYTAWIENKSALKPVNICVHSPIISASFNGLDQGAYYNVSIKAAINRTNQPALESEINRQQFRVKANSSGKVSDLRVPDIGSRSAKVTWKRPQKTGGTMTGYKVLAIDQSQQTCVSAVMFVCTDCNIPMTDEQATVCTKVNNETTTQSELNNADVVFSANLTGLLPDVNYTIKVAPYNEAGVGLNNLQSITTHQEPAEPLLDQVKLESVGKGQLKVSWSPGTRTGPTSYNITWAEESSIGSGTYSPLDQTIIQSYNTQSYVITDLLSYWNYNVSVQVSARLGSSDQVYQVGLTAPSDPEALKSVDITQRDTAQSVEVLLVCPDERKRNGRITKFTYTSVVTDGDQQQTPPQGNIDVDPDVCRITYNIPVTPETGYNFTFRAVNYEGQQGIPTSQTVTVDAKAPMLEKPVGGPGFMKTSETSPATTKSVPIEMCSCLLDPKEGNITDAGLKICDKATDCKPAGRGSNNKAYYDQLKTWKQFRDANFIGVYRSSEKYLLSKFKQASGRRRRSASSRRVARAAENYLRYVIGENQTCETAAATEYCNGPLPPDTEFIVIVWACTAGGCSEAQDPLVIRTAGISDNNESVNTGVIVGVVLAFLAVVVIIIILVVIVYRRRHRPKDSSSLSTNQQPIHQVEDILHDQKSVSLILYPARVELLHRNSNHYFKQEYQELFHEENAFNYTSDVGKLDINKVKNRSAEICPYDYTRVKLFSQDDLGQDYINASYIVGLRSPCDYLATQGPMMSTISDFWKMVLDHRSTVIVMLSGSTDDGLSKVDQYWPHALNVSVRYGKVNVTMTSMATLPKYTLRNFSVCTNEQDELKVLHFQLMGWEVQGSTFSLEEVADTLYDVGERTSSPAGPVTVHCSDGTARTGSFIALDLLRTDVTQHALGEEVDVFHILLNIIKCRPRMVQSERQYMFIHDVLRVMVERKMRDEQGRREVYQNVGFGESSVYDTTYSYVPEGSVYETIGNKTPSATTGV